MENPTLVSFLFVLLLFFISHNVVSSQKDNENGGSGSGQERVLVRVGLVLDLDSMEGKMVQTSVSVALSDFYASNNNYKTRVSVSVRNSRGEPLLALASAVDLLQTEKVEAIIGGGDSLLGTKLLAEIGEKARVPVISLNSPLSSSLSKYNHLIQATHDSVSEAKGITSFLNGFHWGNVTLVYEDDDDWREGVHLLVDRFHENAVRVHHKDGFTVSLDEDFILGRLGKMKDSGAKVFVVHLSKAIAIRLFSCAGKLGMMSDGFAWILTVKTMDSFHGEDEDDFAKEAMEGVVGFKSYIPVSEELSDFTSRWRKSLPIEEEARFGLSSLLAHDIAWALAKAVEVASSSSSSTLLEVITTESRFKGLSGEFRLDGKKLLLLDKFEIVNMMGSGERRIGFWNANGSFSNRRRLSSSHNNLETIIWPGGSSQSPKLRNLEESRRKLLRVLVTSSNRFPRLMKVETNPVTKVTTAEGFCIDVFLASIDPFDYDVVYIPWLGGSNYDELAYKLNSQKDKYDAAVGDITITNNRSTYVDFTVPYTEMGLGIVAAKERSMWVFFKPLTPDLWITSAAFFVLTGIIVWLIERPDNPEFQGSWSKQIGIVFWFGFSTLVYAHRERLKQNLSRFVVTVWVFAVLILTASYTATLTSMMTVQQIRFNSNEDFVGHLSGSFIANTALTNSSLRAMRSLGLNSSQEYAQALLNKTVSVVVDELPYLKVLLGENPAHFHMVKTQCTTNGFGFMFQKGSELVPNVSREIWKLRTSEKLNELEKRWFEIQLPYTTDDASNPVNLYRFRGLFMITGVSFAFALAVLLIRWLQEEWRVLVDSVQIFLSRRLMHFRIFFEGTIHPCPLDDPVGENTVHMAQRS